MPSEYLIRYLPAAQDDLLSILKFISQDNPKAAAAFIDKLDNRIGNLKHHPLLGWVPRHPKLFEYGYRVLIIDSYLVFYVIHKKTIEIHRVIHASRNLDLLI